MKFPILKPRSLFRRKTVKDDALAGLVLGVESIPDGLASGLLAGVNPVAGVYGYLYGMIGGALFTSTAFITVQATGAFPRRVAPGLRTRRATNSHSDANLAPSRTAMYGPTSRQDRDGHVLRQTRTDSL